MQARDQLLALKKERDECRDAVNKMKQESGLLCLPNLLKDMDQAMTEVKVIAVKVENYRNDYEEKSRKVRALRKNMELIIEGKEEIDELAEFLKKAKERSLQRKKSSHYSLTKDKSGASKFA